MKKVICVTIIVLMISSMLPVALAGTTVNCDKTKAYAGDSIKVYGSCSANKLITIKVVDQKTNIIYLNTVSTSDSDKYDDVFIVPENTPEGLLTLTAGSGAYVAKVYITIIKKSEPSLKPTPEPTPKPKKQTPTPTITSYITPTLVPNSNTPSPTLVPEQTQIASATATPAVEKPSYTAIPISGDIDIDKGTGIVTIVIDINTLPDDTKSIKTPDGNVKSIADAKDGKITLYAAQQELDENGQLEIIVINNDEVPFGSVKVKVLEGNKPSLLKIVLWIILILIAIMIIPAIILVKKLRSL